MAEPARQRRSDAPRLDPSAVERAYRLERAKRRARVEHAREQRRARLRFLATLVALLALSLVLYLTAWQEVRRLFGI